MSENKYLEKIAKLTNYAGAAIGGTLGAGLSYSSKRDVTGKKYTKSERILNGVSGGLSGAWLGHNIHAMLRTFRDYKKYKDTYKNGNPGFKSKTSSIHDLHKDLEMPVGGFKTKAEATRHYKKMAMKNHPDRGGDVEKMKKINTAWENYKKHPDGFEKLAGLSFKNYYLDSIHEQILGKNS